MEPNAINCAQSNELIFLKKRTLIFPFFRDGWTGFKSNESILRLSLLVSTSNLNGPLTGKQFDRIGMNWVAERWKMGGGEGASSIDNNHSLVQSIQWNKFQFQYKYEIDNERSSFIIGRGPGTDQSAGSGRWPAVRIISSVRMKDGHFRSDAHRNDRHFVLSPCVCVCVCRWTIYFFIEKSGCIDDQLISSFRVSHPPWNQVARNESKWGTLWTGMNGNIELGFIEHLFHYFSSLLFFLKNETKFDISIGHRHLNPSTHSWLN